MAHNEFPELTHEAKCVLMQFKTFSSLNWNRRFAAAVIREAVRQAGTFTVGTRAKGEVVEVVTLNCIADNLHALPPPPPTREQMKEALRSLLNSLDCHPGSQLAQEAAILAAGIAHHCKVQP
jgi:hypothetical protein